MVCPMQLKNTGKVTLTGVTAASIPTFLSNDCAPPAELAPDATVDCSITAAADQNDFDAGAIVLVVNATAGHLGDSLKTLAGTLSYGSTISLNNSASMDLTVSSEPNTVAASGGVAGPEGYDPNCSNMVAVQPPSVGCV